MRGTASLALAVALTLLASACSGGPSPGPLGQKGGIGGSWTGIPVKPGQFADTGFAIPANSSNETIVFESFRPHKPSSANGLELRTGVTDVLRCGEIGGAHGWPPAHCKHGRLQRLAGYRYRPGMNVSILVGARASRPGKWFMRSFDLDYRIGSNHYQARFTQGLKLKVRGR